jgi:NTE family protein
MRHATTLPGAPRSILACLITMVLAGCAAPLQRAPIAPTAAVGQTPSSPEQRRAEARQTIGVAFGGGSARGIAHIGVIRWLAEHRIPIDVAAGTSMGGLIGGAFATGMDADELERMVEGMNWDDLFGSSGFAFKNLRRKTDARAYPSRIEFGLRGGIVPPSSLNTGEQVERFIGGIAAPYYEITSFDELPTPFRAVAVDLVTSTEVVLDHGSLATAMRATMSLPLVFPPVEFEGRVLVDGGAMNNVPADVARTMGADRVVAINVGNLENRESLSYTLLSVATATLDSMARASSRRAIASADVVINVPLRDYGALDWRRSTELIQEGYKAAEAMRDALLPLAVSEEEYARWTQRRQGRRRTQLPAPAFTQVEGFAADDARRLETLLPRYVGAAVNVEDLERDLAPLSGLDRYQTVTWRLTRNAAGQSGLVIAAVQKPYAPPFMMLGLNLENTTSNDFRIAVTGRYLAYDVLGSGSELRVDGTLGSDPGLGIELYEPIRTTPFFVAPYATAKSSTFNLVSGDQVYARYDQDVSRLGVAFGANLGATSDLRIMTYWGKVNMNLAVGDPAFPAIEGSESTVEGLWRIDTQDSAVIPSRGTVGDVSLRYVYETPELKGDTIGTAALPRLTQLSGTGSHFWNLGDRYRIFLYGGGGTSFDDKPLPPSKFPLGSAVRLGAYAQGELRGNHYWVASSGVLRRIARLPDFMGGPVYLGSWLENGDAFDEWQDATWRINGSVGIIADTLIGPVMIAGTGGVDRWRMYVGVGRIFR